MEPMLGPRDTASGAIISSDERYRYRLWRTWGNGSKRLLAVMLNPSTADASRDDATIRKITSFAKRWGFGSLDVVNLFAFRSTDPKALWGTEDPIGPENDLMIASAATEASLIVAGWGSEKKAQARGDQVLDVLTNHGDVYAFKVTSGPPHHPLYVPYATERVLLRGRKQ